MKREGVIVLCRPMSSDPRINVIVIRCADDFEIATSIPKSRKVKLGDHVSVQFDFHPEVSCARA